MWRTWRTWGSIGLVFRGSVALGVRFVLVRREGGGTDSDFRAVSNGGRRLDVGSVRIPWALERLVLRTHLTSAECRKRLSGATRAWPRAAGRTAQAIRLRGLVLPHSFCLGRIASHQTPPRTWVRGRLIAVGASGTQVDLTIGPNPITGFVLIALFAMIVAGAIIAVWLSATTPWMSPRTAVLCWLVVGGYAGVFFGVPAFDYAQERQYLLSFVERTLDATIEPAYRATVSR